MSSFAKSVLAAGLLFAAAGSSQAAERFSSEMEGQVMPALSGNAADGKVSFSLTNHGNRSLHLLRYQTPFDGIEENLFDVRLNGQRVGYTGPVVKRAAPSAEDYIELKAGETRTVTVDLGLSYDMRNAGMYEVRFNNRLSDMFGERASKFEAIDRAYLRSKVSYVWVDGFTATVNREAALRESIGQSLALQANAVSYTKCTVSQQGLIPQAVTAAQNYAADSNSYLGANKQGTRYTKWFGVYDSGRYSTVKSHFTKIATALANTSMAFDCGCHQKNTYAYVYPNQPYSYHLCGAFWTAPMTGTDSKGGTLIHETSHFDITAGTNDWVYGQSGAANLAITDPAKAIDNADSHEYFSENTPAGN